MKKIITTLTLAVFSCFFSNAQDKVGINTTDPDETLHVIGDIILLESPNGTKKVMLRTGGTSGELKSLGDLYIRGQNADVLINHVGTDGNVGINTATPMEELDVNGAIRINNTTSNNIGTIRFNTDLEDFEGYDGTAWKSLTSGGGGVWTEDGSKVYYLGSVGINTTSPNADLHIVGDTLLLESPDGTKNLLLRNAGADSEVKSIGDLYIRGQGNDVLINHVGTDGNVGIGTATPSEKLVVAGDMLIEDDPQGAILNLKSQIGGGIVIYDETGGYSGALGWDLANGAFTLDDGAGVVMSHDGSKFNFDDKVEINGDLELQGSTRNIFHESSLNINSLTEDSTSVLISPTPSSSGGESTLLLAEDNDGTYGIGLHYDGDDNWMRIFGKNSNNETSILLLERDSKHAYFYDGIYQGGTKHDKPSFEVEFEDTFGQPFNNLIRNGQITLNSVVTPEAVDPGSESIDAVIPMLEIGGATEDIKLFNTKYAIPAELSIEIDAWETTDMGSRINMYGFSGENGDDYQNNISLESNDNPNEGAKIYLRNWAGAQKIILDADFEGNARITTDELRIQGGSDLAEYFDISDSSNDLLPGQIVSINPKKAGQLMLSNCSYDKKVTGVISGANGIKTGFMMSQIKSIANGAYPVALTGRVFVYANNEGGEIKPGDFLTTSNIMGQAMKVQDFEKAQGAIIGKAMTEVDENGFVLILVNLQ